MANTLVEIMTISILDVNRIQQEFCEIYEELMNESKNALQKFQLIKIGSIKRLGKDPQAETKVFDSDTLEQTTLSELKVEIPGFDELSREEKSLIDNNMRKLEKKISVVAPPASQTATAIGDQSQAIEQLKE